MTLGQIPFELNAAQVENCKCLVPRAITLQMLNKSTRKRPGAQLHILNNISIKFHDNVKSCLSYVRHKRESEWLDMGKSKCPPPPIGGAQTNGIQIILCLGIQDSFWGGGLKYMHPSFITVSKLEITAKGLTT
jgi:hypothetical protein